MQSRGKVANFGISQEGGKGERNKEKAEREKKQKRHLVPPNFPNPFGAV